MDNTITVRKIEVRDGKTREYHEAVGLAIRLLIAKITKDKRNKELCTCLEVIGDNPPCPIHK